MSSKISYRRTMLQILNVQLVRQTFSIQKQRLQMMFHTSMCVNLQQKLCCRRKTARSIVSLNISLSHLKSLRVIRN